MSSAPKPSILRRVWLRTIATAGVTAAVLLSWWWKVQDARAPDVLPVATLGQPVDLGRSRLTPLALEWRAGGAELVLRAEVENITGETQVAMFGNPPSPPEMRLGDDALEPPLMLLARDQALLQDLQPRLPERIDLVWKAPAGWQGGPVTLRFFKEQFKLRDNLYGQSGWLGAAPVAQMELRPKGAS